MNKIPLKEKKSFSEGNDSVGVFQLSEILRRAFVNNHLTVED